MIPFVARGDGRVINLLTISRVQLIGGGETGVPLSIQLVYADGQSEMLHDDAASFMADQIGFALTEYRKYQQLATGQIQQPQIVIPTVG
jgi:hypothetical protein